MMSLWNGRRASSRQAQAGADAWLGMTDDLVRRFVDVLLVEQRYSLTTCAGYRTDVRNLDRWLQRFEWCTVVTASDEQLIKYLAEFARRPSSPRLPRVLLSLRRFYSFLYDSHVRDDDPMLSPAMVRWCEQRRPRSVTLWRQRESGRAAAARDRVMLALLIAGGLQAEQLIALRLDELDLQRGCLWIHESPGMRSVSLSPTLIEMVGKFLRAARETLLRGRDSAHVFPSCGGRALTRREFWSAFRRRAESYRAIADVSSVAVRSNRWSFGRDSAELACQERL